MFSWLYNVNIKHRKRYYRPGREQSSVTNKLLVSLWLFTESVTILSMTNFSLFPLVFAPAGQRKGQTVTNLPLSLQPSKDLTTSLWDCVHVRSNLNVALLTDGSSYILNVTRCFVISLQLLVSFYLLYIQHDRIFVAAWLRFRKTRFGSMLNTTAVSVLGPIHPPWLPHKAAFSRGLTSFFAPVITTIDTRGQHLIIHVTFRRHIVIQPCLWLQWMQKGV